MTQGYFITGTDTNIGKTFVAAALTLKLNATYWKPVQTGSPPDDDTATVRQLTGLPEAHFLSPLYCYRPPVSPHLAARMASRPIEPARLTLPPASSMLVVEGAGGALVPLTDTFLMRDLMVKLGLPVIIVASTRLGTINHTLLTLEALRTANLTITGVVMNGAPHPDNVEAVRHYGKTPVLGWLPQYREVTPEATRDAAVRLTL